MSDLKVGDRFSVEGVVTELADPDGEYCARFDGAHSGGYVARSIMAHATLVEPADKVAENKVLDLSKPVRLIGGSEELEFIQLVTNGMIIIKWPSGSLDVLTPDEIENVPEPKRTASRDMVMVDDGMGTRPYILYDHMEFEEISFVGKVIARGTVTLTEGDGL